MKRVLALALLLGCSTAKPGRPPEIAYGRQECARCGMIVSEERFAAGYVRDDGEAVAFDDLGEMLSALDEKPEFKARAWARDLKGGGWIRLADAHIVHVPGLATPMGTGWVAFARRDDGEVFLKARAGR